MPIIERENNPVTQTSMNEKDYVKDNSQGVLTKQKRLLPDHFHNRSHPPAIFTSCEQVTKTSS